MQLPPRISFRPRDHSEVLAALVQENAVGLGKFAGHIVSRRVVAQPAGKHHQHGNLCEVRIDLRTVPGVHKAVQGNPPRYGVEDGVWFLAIHCFTKYIEAAFFRGAPLHPVPSGESKHKDVRYLDVHEDDQLDEAQFAAWVQQASQLPGERM
jgi:hypothetical protein